MPGYLVTPLGEINASSILITPYGNITSDNLQSAIYELDTIKPQNSSVATSISSVEGVALLGL